MPELPEVETVRRQLEEAVVGRKVRSVRLLGARTFPASPSAFSRTVVGAAVSGVRRRAKMLLIDLSNGRTVMVHLKMTGRFRLISRRESLHRHARAVFDLGPGGLLAFEDLRRFGFLRAYPAAEAERILDEAGYGPEPIDPGFTAGVLAGRLARSPKRAIKAALLDQKIVAGVGNIYADESLWRAGLRPDRPAGRLAFTEISALRQALVAVMKAAIRNGGTSAEDFFDINGRPGRHGARLRAYGRDGQPCFRCGRPLKKGRVAGRGTHWCDRCQK